MLFSLGLLYPIKVLSQNYSYKLLTTKDGLPAQAITGVTKDKNGVIWFGTSKGLCYIENGKIKQFKGLPDEGVLSVFASSDGALWVGLGKEQFLVSIKNGNITSHYKQKKARENGLVLGMFEDNNHLYLAQNDGITVVDPKGKFKPLTNKIVSDTMMSYWTVDFFKFNNKVYAASVIRGVNEIQIRENDVVFKNVYKGDFLYGAHCLNNNLILSFDPEAKLFNAEKFINGQNQNPIKTVSSRRPAVYTKDRENNVFGACYNMNYGYHGLIKINKEFKEELLLSEIIGGQEIYFDEINNYIYFGSGLGLIRINASLFSKDFNNKFEGGNSEIISCFPTNKGIVALTDGGLFQFDLNNAVKKQLLEKEFIEFANKTQANPSRTFTLPNDKKWEKLNEKSFQLDDLKWVNHKFYVTTVDGFFIVNENLEIEDFVQAKSTNFHFLPNGNMLFDLRQFSLVELKLKPKKELVYNSFNDEKFAVKELLGLGDLNGNTIVITANQGVYSYENKKLKALSLKNLNSRIYRCGFFQNRFLVLSTSKGDVSFYDSQKSFQLVKTIKKSQLFNESILDLKANSKYLVFNTAKRIFIWDGVNLKSYSEYQNNIDLFGKISLVNDLLTINSHLSIIRIQIPKLLKEIDKQIVVNVTQNFTKNNEPIFNQASLFEAQKNAIRLQFTIYNELEKEVFQSYYKTEGNDWFEIDADGKIILQNLSFGTTKIEFKVLDKRSGKIAWSKVYTISNPAPWYFSNPALVIYFLLFSGLLISITRYLVLRSKRQEIERLTMKNRLNELQMEALQSQMNPHFVFNALNSVQKFILNIDQEKALLFLNQFSVLIRKVLDYSTTKSITIEEELSFLKLYLSIENQRFKDSIKLVQNLQCDEELQIPPLLIQPLFENAIIYGSRNLDGELNIYFSLAEEGDHLKIEVRNELNKDLVKNHSFQSRSTDIIHKRLSLFEGKARFETRIEGSFFIAKILLPIRVF